MRYRKLIWGAFWTGLVLVVAVAARPVWNRLVPPQAGEATPEEGPAFEEAAKRFSGEIVWSSTRSGNHDLHRLVLRDGDARLERLTEHPHVDTFPRYSPDGRHLVFNRSRDTWVSFRDPKPWDVWVMDLKTGAERLVAPFGYHPTFTPDGSRVLFDREGRVISLDWREGGDGVAFDAKTALGAGWVQEPDLRGDLLALTVRGGTRQFGVQDIRTGEFRAFPRPGCQIFWWPGRDRLVWIRSDKGANGGNLAVHGDPRGEDVKPLIDLPGRFSHQYFPRFDPSGRWLVIGAAAEGHEHDRADYEIFLWEAGTPAEEAMRLTHHSGNDQWPDVRPDPAR